MLMVGRHCYNFMKICIEKLAVQTIIGVYAHEKAAPQPLLISLEINLLHHKALASDLLEDTIDYYALSQQLIAFLSQEKTELIECLAQKIVSFIWQHHELAGDILIRIDKPNAVPEAAMVAIHHIFERQSDG